MNIRELILKNDISQGKLAEKLGCSRSLVNQFVSEKKQPKQYIVKLIKLLQEKGELK